MTRARSRLLATIALWTVLALGIAQRLSPEPPPGIPVASKEGISSFPPSVRRWAPQIRRHAVACGLDPVLVAALITAESCGDHRAVSPQGARGLMQVMPFHFAPGEDPFDPDTNLRVGIGILCRLLREADGDIPRALAAYNGGPRLLRRTPSAWPAESKLLVSRVTRHLEAARAGQEIRCP